METAPPSIVEKVTSSLKSPADSANSSVSNDAVADKVEKFETIAATVPDAIGGPEANAGAVPELIAEPGEAPDGMEPTDVFVLNHATVRFYLKFGFEQAARVSKDKRWQLENDELDAATPVTLPVAEKWLAWLLAGSAYKEEIAFCIVMAGIVGPRLLMPKLPKQDGSDTSVA